MISILKKLCKWSERAKPSFTSVVHEILELLNKLNELLFEESAEKNEQNQEKSTEAIEVVIVWAPPPKFDLQLSQTMAELMNLNQTMLEPPPIYLFPRLPATLLDLPISASTHIPPSSVAEPKIWIVGTPLHEICGEGELVWLILRFHEIRRKSFHFSSWERDDCRWV